MSRKTPARVTLGRLLDAVPRRNNAVRVEPRGEGLVLWTSIQKRWWMGPPLSWVLPYRDRRGTQLDANGRWVWEACDGDTSIERIVERFAADHVLRFHEARLLVMQFLEMLMQRRLVAVVGEPVAETDDE